MCVCVCVCVYVCVGVCVKVLKFTSCGCQSVFNPAHKSTSKKTSRIYIYLRALVRVVAFLDGASGRRRRKDEGGGGVEGEVLAYILGFVCVFVLFVCMFVCM